MASFTPVYGFPYPAPGELGSGPQNLHDLAQAIEDDLGALATTVSGNAVTASGALAAAVVTLNNSITAVQNDVNLNEADGDAADLALGNRLTVLEADTGWVTAGFASLSGWSLTTFRCRKLFKFIEVRVVASRTGATITAGADGSITDSNICTVPAGYRPTTNTLYTLGKANATSGGVYLNTGGTCVLTDMHPTSTLAAGQPLTFNFLFLDA